MPKPSNLVRACKKAENAIERLAKGSGGHKRRSKLRRELALWLASDFSIDTYPGLSALTLPFTRWDDELRLSAFRVAGALHLIGRYGVTRAKAVARTGCLESDLDYALDLLKEASIHVHDLASHQSADLESAIGSDNTLEVRLEPRAIEDLLLATAESYKVPQGKGFKYAEVYGLCFGGDRTTPNGEHTKRSLIHVSRVATQLRAKGDAHSVMPNDKSLRVQLEIAEKFFPHLEILGDFHSHPFKTLNDLKSSRGWEYSDADEQTLEPFLEELAEHHHRPRFSLIAAVAQGGKKGQPSRLKKNVVQVAVDNLYFVVAAYRILLNASYDEGVQLVIPADIV